uniref:NADH-ubiquinone oxidoreductase chain 2 n=1 Tax=Neochauliodes punctatolosus TaxID=1204440 RepID=K4GK48_NEOPN|nr:NADH dehydrogenase subunit 2 [Neochauliodes punctatolosus]AFN10575.1 NADH dehydrogenase subunit 2 [Neochauliodes punctatolosus]
MYINSSKMIFFFCLILGTLLAISSNSWLGAWMGLEINLLSFIPLMSNSKNILSNESALKYFLVQALASSILLFSVILFFISSSYLIIKYQPLSQLMINSALLLKMGAAPFHFWFPSVMENLSWINCLILMSWQKLAPLMLISYCLNNNFIYFITMLSLLIGAIGGFNQLNLRSLMAYSSISHLGWMLISMIYSETMWITYYLFYVTLSSIIVLFFQSFSLFFMSQMYSMNMNPYMKFMMMTNMLSLGGLPPFLGFMPKLLVINLLSSNQMYFMIFFMVMLTLITLFYYLRITYSAFMLMYPSLKWLQNSLNTKTNYHIYLNTLSILGFPFISLIYSLY